MKTIKEIAKEISEKEGKKVEVSLGNIREVLSVLSDMIFQDDSIYDTLLKNGKRRAKK